MIFKPEMVEKILAGEKTETRRLVKYEGRRILPCRYRKGHDYALQPGRSEPGIGPRLLIESVRYERLGEITDEAAEREGFGWEALSLGGFASPKTCFLAYWDTLHGHVDLRQAVWVIRFELVWGGA